MKKSFAAKHPVATGVAIRTAVIGGYVGARSAHYRKRSFSNFASSGLKHRGENPHLRAGGNVHSSRFQRYEEHAKAYDNWAPKNQSRSKKSYSIRERSKTKTTVSKFHTKGEISHVTNSTKYGLGKGKKLAHIEHGPVHMTSYGDTVPAKGIGGHLHQGTKIHHTSFSGSKTLRVNPTKVAVGVGALAAAGGGGYYLHKRFQARKKADRGRSIRKGRR